MFGVRSGLLEWSLAVVACIACGIFAIVGATQAQPGARKVAAASAAPIATEAPTPAATTSTTPPVAPTVTPKRTAEGVNMGAIGAIQLSHQTAIRAGGNTRYPALSVVGKGVILPIDGHKGKWVHVMTPCEVGGWVKAADGDLIAMGSRTSNLHDAVIVIDPGHGGSESGAVGNEKLQEQDINLILARKLAADLGGARVYLTRRSRYNVGLRYRALLASKMHAMAFVSMHNNSGPTIPSLHPGTQTWHQVHSIPSTQLAVDIYRDLYAALSKFTTSWVRSPKIGPLGRVGDKGHDYYAVLRQSTVPSVIVESLYISNLGEERLLREGGVQDAIASATAHGITRFITSGDAAKAAPYKVKLDRSGGLAAGCRDPL